MKTLFLLPGIAAALLVLPNHDQGQDQQNVPALKVYRVSELLQHLSESEQQAWKNIDTDHFWLVAKGLQAVNPSQRQYSQMNIWPDVDLVMVDGTNAEQEATKKVVEALRRGQPAVSADSAPRDANQTIEHIKHELTYLQHALQEHK